MEQKIKRSMRVMGCALVATALALSMVPATQAHAASKKPAQAKSVKVSKIKTTSAKITWKKSPTKKVKGYQVKIYKGKKTYKTYTVKGRSTTSKTATGLKANTTYTTKVRAYTTKRSKKKTVKVYGKYSSAKKFTTKKTAKKPSNPSSNSNNNTNSKPSSEHKHAYTVYHPAVWKTETVPAQFNSYEIGGIKYNEEMIIPKITKKTLVHGSYYSCKDGTVPNHEHNETIWKSEQNIIHYEDLSNLGFQCNTCKEVFPSTQERFNHSKREGHENGETQIENYYKEKYKDDQFETVLYCPVCGKIKSE